MSWTIERPPGRPVRRTGDNRLAVPLRLCLTGGQATDTELALTLAEAVSEHFFGLHRTEFFWLHGQAGWACGEGVRAPVAR